ncbi:MOSC domain-containing protein [Salininema proteolyticum]|uniref:MOSC domain-containing protein n=1 Tax=Salininema proteolyticum TaxID=1607685 RepID=A0ABV8U2W1_9ACTN
MNDVGYISQLRRYPVKSLLGERVRTARVDESGVQGDRRLALLDRETGKVVSAKQPRLWREALLIRARDEDGVVFVELPDGAKFRLDDPGSERLLSDHLGRDVAVIRTPPSEATIDRADPDEVLAQGVTAKVDALVSHLGAAAPAGTFFDFAPLHLFTSATLDHLKAEAGLNEADVIRYRPNLVIQGDLEPYGENSWAGRRIVIGDVRLRVIARTPRCSVPTLDHGGLGRNTGALRSPARENRVEPLDGMDPEPCAGVYAQVEVGGEMSEGTPVSLGG